MATIGFLTRGKNVQLESETFQVSGCEFAINKNSPVAIYQEKMLLMLEQSLGLNNRFIFDCPATSYPNEPGLLDWFQGDNLPKMISSYIVNFATMLKSTSEDVYFFLCEEEWTEQNNVHYVQGDLTKFEKEFQDVFPFGYCKLSFQKNGQAIFENVTKDVTLFKIV